MSIAPLASLSPTTPVVAVVPAPQVPEPSPATEALPLPSGAWGAVQALAALDEARDLLPFSLPDAVAVSVLTTVVLRAGDYAVKVYPAGTDPAHLDRVAAALAGSRTAHLPVTRALPTRHGLVTLAPWLPATRPVTWPNLGALLREFHDEHAAAPVAPWTPLSRLASQVDDLPEDARQVLLDARDGLLAALSDVTSELGAGVVHGDVSPSNALSAGGAARLIDLDWVAVAPREYDLSGAARRYRAGEITRRCYRRFCASYGFDVMTWKGLPVLDLIADLSGVAFRLWDDRFHGRPLDWLPTELARWRTPF